MSGFFAVPSHRRGGRLAPRLAGVLSLALVAATFALTPAGAASGSLSVVDFSQCANGAPSPKPDTGCPRGWINGALQKSNSHYAEDQVVPQRIVATVPGKGTHTFQISWQDRKGSANSHAYDSLASWDFTQKTADPCAGLSNNSCPAASPAQPSTTPIPLDPTPVVPCAPVGCSTKTSDHQLTDQVLTLYGGTLVPFSASSNPYSHSAASSLGTDDYTTLTVTYTTTGAGTVELLYGGHLAPTSGPRGWGSPYGSANINGGPYHFKFQTLDGASAGSRDNQIQASAILGPPSFTVSKSASPTTAAPGQLVTYTITVTNTGNSAGSTTFTEANDSRVTNVTYVGSNPTGGTCTPITGTNNLSCVTSTIDPGKSQVFTVTVKMPTTFSGAPGGGGCGAGQYPIIDTVTLADGQQAQARVCVNAAPSFTVTKSASPSTAAPGDTVTYTITVTNGGSAAGSTTFKDDNDPNVTNVSFVGSNPTGGTCSPIAGTTDLSCATSSIDPGKNQVFTVTAKMPTTFSGAPATGCGAGQYPVIDTVTLANGQQAQAKVCVNAAPAFTVTKSASPTTASPGQLVTYTITVTNGGSASGSTTFKDDNDPNVTSVTFVSSSPTGGTCSPIAGTTDLSCTTSSIDPGESQVFTVTAKMPTAFSGASGGGSCSTGQYPVDDTATLANGQQAKAEVCVNAAPIFTVSKSASPTTASPGQLVTYTITVTNGGSAAGSTTFTDDNDPNVTNVTFVSSSPAGGTCSPIIGTTDLSCATSSIDPAKSQVFTVTAKMPATFLGTPAAGCGSDQYPVFDTVTLANGQQAQAKVCVNAAPAFTVTKSASPTTASPGDTVTYTITVSNSGSASGSTTFTDDNDPYVTAVTFTGSVPAGGSCSPIAGTTDLSCSTTSIDPSKSQVFTVTAKMPATFSGTSGGGGCSTGQYPVFDTVTLANGKQAQARVCVNATPHLTLAKKADATSVKQGDQVTYTLTYANDGSAPANGTKLTEAVPDGTAFVSCTGGCSTDGPPVKTVTWSLGSVPAGGGGTVTMTVKVTSYDLCSISNTAQISSTDLSAPVPSNTVTITATPTSDLSKAKASGNAVGANLSPLGINLITLPTPSVSSSQTGPGSNTAHNALLNITTGQTNGLLSASLLETATTSSVTSSPGQASDTSSAEAGKLCIILGTTGCTISADVVLGVAHTEATGSGSSFSSAGSTFKNLVINGTSYSDVKPNTVITLPDGSKVVLDEENGSTSQPTGTSGGTYAADLTVTMIHVTTVLGTEISVAKAVSHAEFPQLAVCGTPIPAEVSGHAFVASENSDPSLVPMMAGYVSIPATGGSESQQLTTFALPNDPTVVSGSAANSSSSGSLTTTPNAHSLADVTQGVCVLPGLGTVSADNPQGCLVKADLVRSEVSSSANGAVASSVDTGTKLVNVVVAGTLLPVTDPAPNTTIALPAGLGSVVLNEHSCTNGTSYGPSNLTCAGTTKTGLTVRAIHVILLGGDLPGAEVIVAEAHSDAGLG